MSVQKPGTYATGPLLLSGTDNSNPFHGRLAVSSGDSTVVQSTTAVQSDSIVYAMVESINASHQTISVSVASLNPGVNITFGLSGATVMSQCNILWKIDLTG